MTITFPNYLPRLSSFKPVTLSSIRGLLTKAKPITCLSDTIPTMLLKRYPEAFLPLLTRLINLSLTSGTFPWIWKRAIVKPLLKRFGLENIFKNHRPVSNLIYFYIKITRKCHPFSNSRTPVRPKSATPVPEQLSGKPFNRNPTPEVSWWYFEGDGIPGSHSPGSTESECCIWHSWSWAITGHPQVLIWHKWHPSGLD